VTPPYSSPIYSRESIHLKALFTPATASPISEPPRFRGVKGAAPWPEPLLTNGVRARHPPPHVASGAPYKLGEY
jgi:hypothetical protein